MEIVDVISSHPYLGIAIVFILCGIGLPLPEELVLVTAGYLCFKGLANQTQMTLVCVSAILAADILPFTLGRVFGTRLLRLRPMRIIINPRRLARFDRWFRRRGDLVIFFSRFMAGIRVVSYFTAGAMKMAWGRFIFLDLAGILLIAPPLVFVGNLFGATIEDAFNMVTQVEKGILYTILSAACLIGLWVWMRWRGKQRSLVGLPVETYVEPSNDPGISTVGSSPMATGPRLVPPLPAGSERPEKDKPADAPKGANGHG